MAKRQQGLVSPITSPESKSEGLPVTVGRRRAVVLRHRNRCEHLSHHSHRQNEHDINAEIKHNCEEEAVTGDAVESQRAAQREKLSHLIVSLGETSYEYVGSEATEQAHLTCEDICRKGSSGLTTGWSKEPTSRSCPGAGRGTGDKQTEPWGRNINKGAPRHRMEGWVQIDTQDWAQTQTDVVEKQTVKAPGAAFLWELKGTVTCRDLGLKERGCEHQKSPRNQQRPAGLHEYAWRPAGALLGERPKSSHTSCLDMKGNY